MTAARHPIPRLAALAFGTLMGVALLPAAAAAAAAVSSGFPAARHHLEVSGDTALTAAGLMPGGKGPVQTISLRATGALRYRIRVAYTGSGPPTVPSSRSISA